MSDLDIARCRIAEERERQTGKLDLTGLPRGSGVSKRQRSPGARISSLSQRLAHAKYWKEQKEALEAQIEELGADYVDPQSYSEFYLVQEYATKVARMLSFLNDKLVPRDFERMKSDEFR